MDFPQVFFETLGVPLETNVPLREHAHFRIGGEADFFFRASSVLQLVEAVRLALRCRVPYYVIGAGTNLLFDDRGYRGLVIRNDVCGLAHLGKGRVEALSGTPLQDLVAFCTEGGLEGLEFLAGIPGTVGGAVFGNAGAFEDSIGSHLSEALLLTRSGEEMRVGKDYFSFSYRKSRLRESRELVLKAWFQLRRGDRTAIQARIRANLKAREKKHPPKDVP
ncbi:MAG: UDP-N-acetylmuramate dehydrogenase, partial [Candidatus Aminicenantales bacterium]